MKQKLMKMIKNSKKLNSEFVIFNENNYKKLIIMTGKKLIFYKNK